MLLQRSVSLRVCRCSTAIAIRCKDGVVFGVEKLVLSKLYEEGSNKRIFNIDRHVGMVTTHTPLLWLCPYTVHFTSKSMFLLLHVAAFMHVESVFN